MFSLWGWPESIQTITSEKGDLKGIRARQVAEKRIEELGLGQCVSCKEELVKNERGFWESELLLEYCKDAKDHKHRPIVKYKEDNE